MVRQGVGNESGQMKASWYIRLSAAIAIAALMASAQVPVPSFSATTENVVGAPDSVRIDLLRWSTDAERDRLVSAWNMTRATGRGGAGRGGRLGRGAAVADPADDTGGADDTPAPARGRGRGAVEDAP